MDRRTLPRRGFSLFALGLLLAAVPGLAGTDIWNLRGQPSGGSIMKVLVNPAVPTTLYALGESGVFTSTDSGANWNLLLPLPLNVVSDMAIEPESPATMYVTTEGMGIYKTTDGGASWRSINNGIDVLNDNPDSTSNVVVDPVTDGTAYVATLNTGIYKTTDGGGSWHKVNTGITGLTHNLDSNIETLAIDPLNPQVLYLGTLVFNASTPGWSPLTGIFTSVDGGAHWTQVYAGGPAFTFAVDPTDDHKVYAGTNAGIYFSIDGGATWNQHAGNIPLTRDLAIDPADPTHMLAATFTDSVYETFNTGTNWTKRSTSYATEMTSVAFDPATPATAYLGTGGFAVFRSTDGGTSWNESDTGIYGVDIQTMFIGSDGAMYIGSGGTGVLKSLDQGLTWTIKDNGLTTGTGTTGGAVTLDQDSSAPGTLYAGTLEGVFKTQDGGDNWVLIDNGIGDPYVVSFAVDTTDPQVLYDGTDSGVLYKSSDGGADWQPAFSQSGVHRVQAIALDPQDGQTLYIGTLDGGVFKSTDGGSTWNAVNTGLPTLWVDALAIDPLHPDTLYAGLNREQIYKSTDAGASWQRASNGLPESTFTSLRIDPVNPAIVYAVLFFGEGLYVTSDGGDNWYHLSGDTEAAAQAVQSRALSTTAPPRTAAAARSILFPSIFIDPRHHTQVYGGGNDGRVYLFNANHLPSGSGGSGGGGSGGGAAAGGGGGGFPLLAGALLLGLALTRKRQRGLPA